MTALVPKAPLLPDGGAFRSSPRKRELVKPIPGLWRSAFMVEVLELAAQYRRKADECRLRSQNASAAMLEMEWMALAEQWQVLADDAVLVSLVSPSGSTSPLR
jgi:hypothetical protein